MAHSYLSRNISWLIWSNKYLIWVVAKSNLKLLLVFVCLCFLIDIILFRIKHTNMCLKTCIYFPPDINFYATNFLVKNVTYYYLCFIAKWVQTDFYKIMFVWEIREFLYLFFFFSLYSLCSRGIKNRKNTIVNNVAIKVLQVRHCNSLWTGHCVPCFGYWY